MSANTNANICVRHVPFQCPICRDDVPYQCPVCLIDVGITNGEGDDTITDAWISLTPCNHLFGNVCLDTWLERDNGCPLCREVIAAPPRIFHYEDEEHLNMWDEHENLRLYGGLFLLIWAMWFFSSQGSYY
jgi:hypothetical protein